MKVKISHFTDKGHKINGVIHVGANDGEEIPGYKELGIENIICFEPLSTAYALLRNSYPNVFSFKLALGETDEDATLYISAGDGKGSSLLETNMEHPEVQKNWNHGQADIVGEQKVKVRRFDTWAKDAPVNLDDYDCLVLDTQGNELEVLKGMGEHLSGFKYLSVELSEIPVYFGEHPAAEVCEWLDTQGFNRDSPIQTHDDVFFIREGVK